MLFVRGLHRLGGDDEHVPIGQLFRPISGLENAYHFVLLLPEGLQNLALAVQQAGPLGKLEAGPAHDPVAVLAIAVHAGQQRELDGFALPQQVSLGHVLAHKTDLGPAGKLLLCDHSPPYFYAVLAHAGHQAAAGSSEHRVDIVLHPGFPHQG